MDTIKLRKTIEINGKKVSELSYDIDQITPAMFADATARKVKAAGAQNVTSTTVEFDYPLHLYLGFMAIIACNREIDVSDLERISGRDMYEIIQVGRSFFLDSDGGAEDSSDEPSETMLESITQE